MPGFSARIKEHFGEEAWMVFDAMPENIRPTPGQYYGALQTAREAGRLKDDINPAFQYLFILANTPFQGANNRANNRSERTAHKLAILEHAIKGNPVLSHYFRNQHLDAIIQNQIDRIMVTSLPSELQEMIHKEYEFYLKLRDEIIRLYRADSTFFLKLGLTDASIKQRLMTSVHGLTDSQPHPINEEEKRQCLFIMKTLSDNKLRSGGLNNETVLQFAASNGCIRMAEMLIQAGADVNLANNRGKTALMFAAQGGHSDTVRLLLKAGADVNPADNHGVTALKLAEQKGHNDTARILIEARETNAAHASGLHRNFVGPTSPGPSGSNQAKPPSTQNPPDSPKTS